MCATVGVDEGPAAHSVSIRAGLATGIGGGASRSVCDVTVLPRQGGQPGRVTAASSWYPRGPRGLPVCCSHVHGPTCVELSPCRCTLQAVLDRCLVHIMASLAQHVADPDAARTATGAFFAVCDDERAVRPSQEGLVGDHVLGASALFGLRPPFSVFILRECTPRATLLAQLEYMHHLPLLVTALRLHAADAGIAKAGLKSLTPLVMQVPFGFLSDLSDCTTISPSITVPSVPVTLLLPGADGSLR